MSTQVRSTEVLRRPNRSQYGLTLLLIFALVLLAKVVYVSLYAGDLPYWDQWDAEADTLLRPWVEGTLHISGFFIPHAEHRIALTRLLALTLFEANSGQWDNLVEAYVNGLIYAAMAVFLYVLLCRDEVSPLVRWITLASLVLLAALPFDWENMLVGFQSQFYLMAVLAILMVGLIAGAKPSRSTLAIELFLGGCSLFTMASGLLSPAAVIVVLLLRGWCERRHLPFTLAMATSMVLLVLSGLVLIPVVPPHEGLAAEGVSEHLTAWTTALMWPLQSYHWNLLLRCVGAMVLWAPSLFVLSRVLRYRIASRADCFGLGMVAWVWLQALAIAHSRGHDMTALPSRYLDILAIGLLLNLWFATRLVFASRAQFTTVRIRRVLVTAAAFFVLVTTFGLVHATRKGIRLMRERHEHVVQQTRHVFDYVRTGDAVELQQPFLFIPYPDWRRLRGLLDNPDIRAMLPPSVRQPLDLDLSSTVRQGFDSSGLPASLARLDGRTIIGSYSGQHEGLALHYSGATLHSSFPYLQFWMVGSRPGGKRLQLRLVSSKSSAEIAASWFLTRDGLDWRHAYVLTPGGTFHLNAVDRDPMKWFGFSAPVESGRLSMLAHSLQDFVRSAFFGLGWRARISD